MMNWMNDNRPDAGVCVVRAEVQADYLLISVSTSSATTLRRVRAAPEDTRHFVRVDDAIALVRQFLEAFTSAPGERGGCNGSQFR